MSALRLWLAMTALAALLGCGARGENDRETVWQVSVIPALMEGDYEGSAACGELRAHGDFGIGTFDALDGEMIVEGGIVYRAAADGSVSRVEDSRTTPFAAVTFFEADCVATPAGTLDLAALERTLDAMPGAKNTPCAVMVFGHFRRVQIRSVPRQEKPYPRLADAVKRQSVSELRDVVGGLVGFRMPAWARGVNVPGLHLHFLNGDYTRGGHVLSFEADACSVTVDFCRGLEVRVPDTPGFRRVNLAPPQDAELDRVEKPAGE